MKKILMLTAAAMIMGSPIYAQSTQPDLSALQALVNSGQPLTEAQVAEALAGYTVTDIRIDDDGEVRAEVVDANGTAYRVRVDDGQVFYSTSDDGAESDDVDDDNGADTSDDNGDDTSDDNGDDTSDDNGGSSGSDDSDDDSGSDDDNGGSSGGGNGGGSSDGDDD